MPACPFCEGEVSATARKCRHCGEWLQPAEPEPEPAPVAVSANLDAEVARYVAAGYQVESRTAESVILRKAKRFNWVAFILLALLWVLPAVIYLLVYATRGTPTVELRRTGSEVVALGAILPAPGVPWEPSSRPNDRVFIPIAGIAVLMLALVVLLARAGA